MTPGEARLQHLANLLVGASGLGYAYCLYVAEPSDDFALVNHPSQPWWHAAHVVLAPLLVFALGRIWREHAWARVKSGFRPRRKSGFALFVLAGPMIASGYLLQVSAGEGWRALWLCVHLASSALWIAVYAAHPFLKPVL